ncbi:response regulator [Dactylosporangium sp. CS-033363]|uniref:response regulator n=1 Tax=Dactylosporangium sp. CS-033363 TaxID=3239935 RepID=UPI003D8A2CFF
MTDRAPSRVLVCDDQELMRMGLRMVVDSQPDLSVVGEAADGPAAVAAAVEHRPDVVLLDVRMPGLDGVSAAARIRAAVPATRILMITTFDLDEYAFGSLRAGADGFLVKDAPAAEMLVAIRGVLRGDTILAPSVTRRLLDRHVADPPPDARLSRLTEREREVLGLVGRGLSNTEIADRLFLGETTVKTHVRRILGKLQVRDRIGAVVLAHEHRLL